MNQLRRSCIAGMLLIYMGASDRVMVNAIAGGRGSPRTRCAIPDSPGRARAVAVDVMRRTIFGGVAATDSWRWLRWPMPVTVDTFGHDAERSGARKRAPRCLSSPRRWQDARSV